MSDCIFCKIVSKDIPAEIVEEGDGYLAFLDINPRSPGHSVVISRHHSESLLDLPDEHVGNLFLGVKKVAERLTKALSPDGLTFGINQGEVSGQTVKHLHVHILPRFTRDMGGSVHGVVNNPPPEPISEIANKIRNIK